MAIAPAPFWFGKRQFIPVLSGVLVMCVGFLLMATDAHPQGNGFQGLTLAPLLILLGLLLPFLGIFRKNTPKTDLVISPSWRTYQRWNFWAGWIVAAVALGVYVRTLEPSASFWDCGEFIAAAYKLQIPHPPGAPLFLLIGRVFTLLSRGDVTQVAWWMNFLSAISSAGTVLFLFWSITLLAQRLLPLSAEGPTQAQQLLLVASGTVGALAFAFTDSFWFSAVEAEVYAMSSFFTAIVVWAALKWQAEAHAPDAARWLLFLAYLVGLSIGVHLLNLVALPAIALLVYLRKYKPTKWGVVLALLIGGALVLAVMEGVITGLPSVAGWFEVFLVNNVGLPYGGGAVLFLFLLLAGIIYGLRWSKRTERPIFHQALVAFVLVLIGYSSYLMVPIRSGFNPPIDENNPENLLSFVSYLKREQYGSRPLLYGPQFNAQPESYQDLGPVYVPQKGEYKEVDRKLAPAYADADKTLLPRLYSEQPAHLRAYQFWVDVQEGQKPTFGQNLRFLWNYQLNHMYWRYFGWNFIGREHDTFNAGVLWPLERNSDVPVMLAKSKARNQFFLLPLLLGVFGLFFQFKRKNGDAGVITLLFFFTGIAIVLYLNQPPVEPRERDYTFAGSFYAFSIWIGLGVPALAHLLSKVVRAEIPVAALSSTLAFSVPVMLLVQGYNDHDRSGRFHAVDMAKNLLSSVAPNGILFTNGDNDTFPLWYVQEVESFRTDVRVLVMPYLNTDWYVEQARKQMNSSAPLPLTLTQEHYANSTNNYVPFVANTSVQETGMDLKQYLALLKQNHPALEVQTQDGRNLSSLPTKKLSLGVNAADVLQNETISADRAAQVLPSMMWELQANGLEKKHLFMLDVIGTNQWQRPVYFASTGTETRELGLEPYLQQEGMALRLVPARNPDSESDAYVDRVRTYKSLLQQFRFTGLTQADQAYEDNFVTQIIPIYRRNFGELALAYLQANEPQKAREVLQYCLKQISDSSVPHTFESASLVYPLAAAGLKKEAQELTLLLSSRFDTLINYYNAQPAYYERERQVNLYGLQLLTQMSAQAGLPEAKQVEELFMHHYQMLRK